VRTLANPQDKAAIIRRLATLRPDAARRWGRMSAHQMVCHLCDATQMMTGARAVTDVSGLLQRTLVKWAALYLPLRWPPGIPTMPELDPACGGRQPASFAADLATLEALVHAIGTDAGTSLSPRHPFFGRMSASAWHRWAYLHMDHHLRQFGA
jgi:hypothetical protein